MPFIAMPDEPLLAGQAATDIEPKPAATPVSIPSPSYEPEAQQLTATPASVSFDESTYITVKISGTETELSLKEYLRGVLAGEIPASFPEEALKAQAVAARTYIMRDPEAVYCDDPAHCMAYSKEFDPRLDAAIEQTNGEILVYDDEPILAVFFAASSGKTENAVDVWGGDYPYLTAVESVGEEDAPRFSGTVTVTVEEFWKTLDSIKPSDTPFGTIERTPSGGVIDIEISGVKVKGTEMRALFGLNSTNFTVAIIGGNVVFETKGFGHGVGMSQYGARAMALNGADYKEILAHYYTDTRLEKAES